MVSVYEDGATIVVESVLRQEKVAVASLEEAAARIQTWEDARRFRKGAEGTAPLPDAAAEG